MSALPAMLRHQQAGILVIGTSATECLVKGISASGDPD